MERESNSMTEEVKVLVNEFLAGVNGECDRKEIMAYVKEQISDKEKLTDGIIAGALKILTSSGEVIVVSREMYKKGIKLDSLYLRDKVIALLECFQRDLQKTFTINLLGVSNEDVEFIRKISVLSDQLESDIWELEEPEKQEVQTKEKMKNKKIDREKAQGEIEELKRYENQVSIFPRKRKKDGILVSSEYGIAFYYEDLEGKKVRKQFSSQDESVLMMKRTAFLTKLYYEKQKQIKEAEDIKFLTSIISKYLLKEEIHCDKTVNEVIDLYLPFHKARVKYKTHLGEISNSQHIRKLLGKKKVCDLTFNDYQTLLNNVAKGRDGKRASKKTVRAIKGFFARLIKFCKKQSWLSFDQVDHILDDVVMPTTARRNKNAKYLSIENMGKILHTLEDNRRYYLVAKILLLTGMRGQEIFALKKQDLLPEQGLINIHHALEEQEKLKDTDRRYKIGETKNDESDRYAPAIPEVFQCFKELEELQVKRGWREKSYDKGCEDLTIIDSLGQVVDKTCFNRNLGEYLKRRGCEKKLTLHMPRHCYTTYLKLRNANMEDVEFSLGHSMNGVRYEYLAYILPEYLTKLLPKIEEMAEDIRQAEKIELKEMVEL